jgi:hypothetical protein
MSECYMIGSAGNVSWFGARRSSHGANNLPFSLDLHERPRWLVYIDLGPDFSVPVTVSA